MDTKFLRDAILNMSKNPISQNIVITIIEIIIVTLFVIYYKYIQKQEWFKNPKGIEKTYGKNKILDFFKQLFKLKWMHHTLLIMFIVALVINILGLIDKTFVKLFMILMLIVLYLEMIKNYAKKKIKDTFNQIYKGNNDSVVDKVINKFKELFKGPVYEDEQIFNKYICESDNNDGSIFKTIIEKIEGYQAPNNDLSDNGKITYINNEIINRCHQIKNKSLFINLFKNDDLFEIEDLFETYHIKDDDVKSLNKIEDVLEKANTEHIGIKYKSLIDDCDKYTIMYNDFKENLKNKLDLYFKGIDTAEQLERLDETRNEIETFKENHNIILNRMVELNPDNKFVKILFDLDDAVGGTGLIDQSMILILTKLHSFKYILELEYREFYYLSVIFVLVAYLNLNFMYVLEKQSSLFRSDPYTKLFVSLIIFTGVVVIILSLYNEKVYDSSEFKMKYFMSVYVGSIALSYLLSTLCIFVQRQYFQIDKKDPILYKMSDAVVIGTIFPTLFLLFLLQDPKSEPIIKTVPIYVLTIVIILICIAIDNASISNIFKSVMKQVRRSIESIKLPIPSMPYYVIKILIIVIGVSFALLMPK
jgi:hypothetical protein